MATAKKPPDTLAVSLRHQQKWIDEMHASARMRARLRRKIPKPVEFPRGLVDPGQRYTTAVATLAAMSIGTHANAPEGPLSAPADKQNRR
jgi:hypothetical protein